MPNQLIARDFWTRGEFSISDRDVLEGVYLSLVQPIQSIKGWSKALSQFDLSEEEKQAALKWITVNVELLESLKDALNAYLEQSRKPPNST